LDRESAVTRRLNRHHDKIARRDHRRAVVNQEIAVGILRIEILVRRPSNRRERLRCDRRKSCVLGILGIALPKVALRRRCFAESDDRHKSHELSSDEQTK
jgi:hypothetical protein